MVNGKKHFTGDGQQFCGPESRLTITAAVADVAVIGDIFSGGARGQIKQKFPFVTKARTRVERGR